MYAQPGRPRVRGASATLRGHRAEQGHRDEDGEDGDQAKDRDEGLVAGDSPLGDTERLVARDQDRDEEETEPAARVSGERTRPVMRRLRRQRVRSTGSRPALRGGADRTDARLDAVRVGEGAPTDAAAPGQPAVLRASRLGARPIASRRSRSSGPRTLTGVLTPSVSRLANVWAAHLPVVGRSSL